MMRFDSDNCLTKGATFRSAFPEHDQYTTNCTNEEKCWTIIPELNNQHRTACFFSYALREQLALL
jgi:hypothetical protein